MGRTWSRALTVAGLLVAATGVVSCATQRGAVSDPNRDVVLHKIRVTYNAKEKRDPEKRIEVVKVKKDNNSGPKAENGWSRCEDARKCKVGHPIDGDGNPVLDASKTIEDTVLFVSDANSPGRTCVCYGNKCYCN